MIKKLILKCIRKVLGQIILVIDSLTQPASMRRSEEDQKSIDVQTKDMVLYQFKACPFCVKVRREIKRLGLNIAFKDAKKDCVAHEELLQGGGLVKVPCLYYIDEKGVSIWMYESNDIIAFLRERFS